MTKLPESPRPDAPPESEGYRPATGDMPVEEFRRRVQQAGEWAADYLEGVGSLPVLARVSPGEIRSALPPEAPEEAESMETILGDLDRIVMPGVTHWNHPSFHGYFAVTGSGPGILGELVSATLNINAMVWRSSPAGTELELHVLAWLRRLLGLPDGFFGVLHDTASTSSLVALAAARHRAYPESREQGLFGLPPGRIYTSVESHSSIDKAALALGFGRAGVSHVETDEAFRMRPDVLRRRIAADREAGVRPTAIVATLGTTSTTSVDPMEEIATIAREEGIWLHVDAAYAGPVALLPECRSLFHGWEHADSIVVNPHKWLFTPVDCSALYTRSPEVMRAAFSLVPEYLRTAEGPSAVDLMDYGVALGRRFRALKLWFVIRYFGAEGLRARIRDHLELARAFARWVDAEPGWVRMAPLPFATVVFRFLPEPEVSDPIADALNLALMERVNASGEAFLSHTRVNGRIALRLSVGNLRTRPDHLERTWALLRKVGGELAEGETPNGSPEPSHGEPSAAPAPPAGPQGEGGPTTPVP